MRTMGELNLKMDTATGSASPETDCGMPSLAAPETSVGSAASDERVVNATTCAGATARAKSATRILLNSATHGYRAMSAIDTMMQAARTKKPSAPAADAPGRAVSVSTSANTPIGPAARI